MKLFKLPIKITLILTWFLIATNPAISQSGNMSDITMPNPGEVAPETPDDGDASDGATADGDDGDASDGATADGDDTDASDGVTADGDDGDASDGVTADGDDGDTSDGSTADGDDGDASDEATADTATEETPMEESIIGDEEIPTEDNNIGEDTDTNDDGRVAEDNDVETLRGNETTFDNDAAERDVVNENVMDAIANGNSSEQETITNENDFGVTLEENTAGDPNITIEDNVITNTGGETSEINSEIQSDSIIETETNPNTDTPSQSVADDSVEQNVDTTNEADSAQTIIDDVGDSEVGGTTEVDSQVQSDSVADTETNIDSDSNSSSQSVAEDSVEQNAGTTDEQDSAQTITDDVSETDSVATGETATDDVEIAEQTTSTDEDVSRTDSAATEDEIVERTAEELEEKSLAAAEENQEEVAEEIVEENEINETEEEIAEDESGDETEETEETESPQDLEQEPDEVATEVKLQISSTDVAIQMQEELQVTRLMNTSGLQLYGQVPSAKEISARLAELGKQTGKNSAFINISLQSNQLEAFVVLPNDAKSAKKENSLVASTDLNKIDSSSTPKALTLRETIKDTSRKELIVTATKFREEISDSSKLNQSSYMKSSQELYKVLIEPIEAELDANNIDVLVFSMDSGLRLLPLAALHDGEQFLIEKYAVATVPSFGLTDTRYVSLDQSSILAMGASEFSEQAALPTMSIELETIVSEPRQGEVFINEQFTIENFKAQNRRETPFPIVHLGTHAEFKAGSLDDSYIQFYDDRLRIPQLQDLSDELGWNSDATPIELLVLSACETALGDEEAELGFAGLAVQAGVKSALASLWYVSDVGTLALMGEFYDQLGGTLIKAEALRQTQLKMLKGNVKVNNKQVELSNGQNLDLPSQFPDGTLTLDHPYFWSSFTLIGNWN